MRGSEDLIRRGICSTLQGNPYLADGVVLVSISLRRWLPGLHMDGGVMQELRVIRDVFRITCVPHWVESAIQARDCPCLRLHEASALALGFR